MGRVVCRYFVAVDADNVVEPAGEEALCVCRGAIVDREDSEAVGGALGVGEVGVAGECCEGLVVAADDCLC